GQQVRASGLTLANLPQIVGRHVLDARAWHLLVVDAARLQTVQRLLRAELSGQFLEAEDGASMAGNAEESATRSALDGDERPAGQLFRRTLEQGGLFFHGRRIEQARHWYPAAVAPLDLGDEPDGLQRAAAEIQEAIVHPDHVDAQHVAPDAG